MTAYEIGTIIISKILIRKQRHIHVKQLAYDHTNIERARFCTQIAGL